MSESGNCGHRCCLVGVVGTGAFEPFPDFDFATGFKEWTTPNLGDGGFERIDVENDEATDQLFGFDQRAIGDCAVGHRDTTFVAEGFSTLVDAPFAEGSDPLPIS